MVVRMRHTRAHTGSRRAHHALGALALSRDTKTGSVHVRHRAGLDGMYRGRAIKDPVAELERKQKRAEKKKKG